MSESFLVAAAERASGAGTDALTALMAKTGLTGGGLLDAPGFWEKESGAPLLRRNAGFFTRAGIPDALRQRLATWPALAGVSNAAVAAGVCDDEAAFRIFLRDAERTFQDEGHRQAFMELLKSVWPENRDYHQGLGYVCSLLMLVFDTDTTRAILLQLSRAPKYTPGYWRAAPEPYVRDAMVYARLVQEREPEVAKLLQAACVVPEAYASKWFIGLCVHVLPFHALFDYVEAFLKEGYVYLFKFALALVATIKERMLTFKPTDVNKILEVLRLDVQTQYPDEHEGGAFFSGIVKAAAQVELDVAHVDRLREEESVVLAEKMRRTREREAQMAAEESDDEIVFSDEEDD